MAAVTGKPKGANVRRGQTTADGRTDVKVPTSKPGNATADRQWLMANFDDIERIPEEEEGIPFGAQWRWGYSQEELDERAEFISRQPNPCESRSYLRDKEGRYVVDIDNIPLTRACLRAAIPGGKVCVQHGGYNPIIREAARMRIAAASDAVAQRLLAIAFNPSTAEKDVIAACNSLLDRAGIKGGMEIDIKAPGWQDGLKALFEGKFDEQDA